MKTLSIASMLILMTIVSSCKKDVTGCNDPLSDNYNAEVTIVDNNSCTYQKRFLGEYAGAIACGGLFKTAFTKADLSIIELIKKDEVNIIIQSTIGPLPVSGKLSKDTITVDSKLTNLKINLKDLNPLAADEVIDADATIKTKLGISDDNKKLNGVLAIALIPKKEILILGIPFPANSPLPDMCNFEGTKK